MIFNKLHTFYKGKNRMHTSCIKWDLQKERIGVDNLLPFWIADSDYATCKAVTKDLVRRAKHGVFGYTIIDDEYLEIVKTWVKKRYHYEIDKKWIITTPGVVCALHFAVEEFTKENDNVVVSTPVYNPFFSVVENNKRNLLYNKLIEVPGELGTYKIDFADLEEKLKISKMYIFCNPHNPIGRVWTKEEMTKVVELCHKYQVILVSDEIHCDIILGDHEFYSAGNFFNQKEYEDSKIIVCTAPSKTFNVAGLMDSNIFIKNTELQSKYRSKFEKMSLREPNIFGICACKSAYAKGEKWVNNQNEYLKENRDIVYRYFKENIPQAKLFKLEGTYLMWINMKFLQISQDDIFHGLVEHKVLINNGPVYSSEYEGYIRFNIACGRKQLLLGLQYINDFVNSIIK